MNDEESVIVESEEMIRRIVRWYVTGRRYRFLGYDDLMQHGRIGALRAHRTFDSNRSASSKTWFQQCITHEIQEAIRAVTHVRRIKGEMQGYGTAVSAFIAVEGFVENTLASPRADFRKQVEARFDLKALMTDLPERPATIFLKSAVFTQAEISREMGVGESRVSQIVGKTLLALRAKATEVQAAA